MFTPTQFTTYKCVFPNLPITKPVHDSAWLAVTYWKTVHRYSGTSEGSILNVNRPDGFGIDGIICSWEKASSLKLLIQKMLSNEELLIIMRWQINFDRHQTEAAIGQKTRCDWLVDRDRLFGHFWFTCWFYQRDKTGETWEPAKKLCSIGNRGTLNKSSSKLIVGHAERVGTVRVSGCSVLIQTMWKTNQCL